MKTIKISLKAEPAQQRAGLRVPQAGRQPAQDQGDIEHDVRVLLGGMANEELFFGERAPPTAPTTTSRA
jgi:cell division protease FtsH